MFFRTASKLAKLGSNLALKPQVVIPIIAGAATLGAVKYHSGNKIPLPSKDSTWPKWYKKDLALFSFFHSFELLQPGMYSIEYKSEIATYPTCRINVTIACDGTILLKGALGSEKYSISINDKEVRINTDYRSDDFDETVQAKASIIIKEGLIIDTFYHRTYQELNNPIEISTGPLSNEQIKEKMDFVAQMVSGILEQHVLALKENNQNQRLRRP